MTHRLQYEMLDKDIDFDGPTTSDSENEHEPYYLAVFHLMNQDKDETYKETSEEIRQEIPGLSLPSPVEYPAPSKDFMDNLFERKDKEDEENDGDNEEDEDDDDDEDSDSDEVQTINGQKLLFLLQDEFNFEWHKSRRVYRAFHRNNPRVLYALKVIHQGSNEMHKFPMELRVLAYIQKKLPGHPHLPQMQGFIKVKRTCAYLMPYHDSLNDICKQHDFRTTPIIMLEIMRQLLVAIRDLHDIGVIHRDIKPSNILWQNNRLVLIDYDLATWSSKKRRHWAMRGTAGFNAPEIFEFHRDQQNAPQYYTNKIDIYSAGVVFACFLFNMHEPQVNEIFVCAFRNTAEKLIKDPLLVSMLHHMIAVKPDERWTAAQLLQTYYPLQE